MNLLFLGSHLFLSCSAFLHINLSLNSSLKPKSNLKQALTLNRLPIDLPYYLWQKSTTNSDKKAACQNNDKMRRERKLDFCALRWVFDYFLEFSHQLLRYGSGFACADCAFVDFAYGHHFHCCSSEESFVSGEHHERR
jgi:hypothetical protein